MATCDINCRDGTEHMKVSGTGNIKAIAGKLARSIRTDDCAPTVLTIGAPSINMAVKVSSRKIAALMCLKFCHSRGAYRIEEVLEPTRHSHAGDCGCEEVLGGG